MNYHKLTSILGQTIEDVQKGTIDLKKAQTLVKASNTLIKLQCAKIAEVKLTGTTIKFFN